RHAYRRVRAGLLPQSRPAACAQAATAPPRDQPAHWACAGQGADAGAAQAVFQEQSGEGGTGSVPRQEALRQARGYQGAGGGARAGAGDEAAGAGVVWRIVLRGTSPSSQPLGGERSPNGEPALGWSQSALLQSMQRERGSGREIVRSPGASAGLAP